MNPRCEYIAQDDLWKMAIRMSDVCSVVSSVWLAIKFFGSRPYIPTAYDLQLATQIPAETILEMEKEDLNKIHWDVSRFTRA